jgi:PST family polysaccharide transporter
VTASVDAPEGRAGIGLMVRHPVARLFVSMLVVQGSLFVSGTLVVRSIGVTDRGELALVSAMVGIGAQVALLGFPAAFVYFVSSRHLEASRVFHSVRVNVVAQVATLAVLAAGGLLLLDRLGQPLGNPVLEAGFVVVGVIVFSTASLCLAGLQGEQRFTALTVLQALPLLAYAALVATLFLTDAGSIGHYLLVSNLAWLVVPLVTVPLLRRHRGHRTPSGPVPSSREVRSFGVRSAVASASPTDLLGIDQVIIGSTLGHAALGLYVVGWAFETATVLPGNVLAGFVGPRVAAAPRELQLHYAWTWVVRLVAASTLICLVVQLLLEPLVVFAFGDAVRDAVGPGRILLVAGVLLGLRRFLGIVLQSMGHPHWSTWAELASLATMVVGVFALGAAFGINGACTAMVLAGLVGSVVQLVMLARLGRRSDRVAVVG